MALRSGNPTLNAKTFEKFGAGVAGETMSVEGAINKSGFLLFLLVTAWRRSTSSSISTSSRAASRQTPPRWPSGYAAFALMVTLVWLYLEILRLLSKLRRLLGSG